MRRDPGEQSQPIQYLGGGISRQPPHLRFPDQVQDAKNVDFSIAEGIIKRSGSIYGWQVTGATSGDNLRLHPIFRDSNEKYLVVYGRSGGSYFLKAYATDGTAATMSVHADAATYLNSGSATADDLRLRTIADATFILNTTKATATKNSPNYAVTADWPDYDRMRSHTPTQDTYHRTLDDFDAFPAGYYKYNSGTATFAKFQTRTISGREAATPGGFWDDTAGNPYGFKIRFRRRNVQEMGMSWNNATKQLTLAASNAFDDYVFFADDEIQILSGTGFTPGWYKVVARIDQDTIQLDASIVVADTSDVEVDGLGSEYEVEYNTTGAALADMHAVARRLQDALIEAGCTDGLVSWTETGYQTGYFTITGPFRGGGRRILSITSPSGGGTDLAGSGGVFEYSAGTSTSGTGSDSPTLAVDSRWTRVSPPNQADAELDSTTMPVRMNRTVIGPPATFTVNPVSWDLRIPGDPTTNPSPSVFKNQQKLTDIGFHRERLFVTGGESAVFSEAGDIFNFYRTEIDVVLDSDPIDLQLASDRVTIIDHAIPWRDTIVVFTKAERQFVFSAPEALTPTTGSFTASTSYHTQSARPVTIEPNIYFAADGGGTNGHLRLMEGLLDADRAAMSAGEVSAHVPEFLPATARTVAAHSNSRKVFVLPSDGNTIYLYTSHLDGGAKRQSAWTVYQFHPNYRIVDIAVLADDLFMLVETGSNFYVERVPITPDGEMANWPFPVRIDRRVVLTGVHSAGTTTWTMPSGLSDTTIDTIVLGPSFGGSAGTILTPTSAPGTTVTRTGDYSAGACVLGKSFTTSVELSRPFVLTKDSRPVFDDSFQQRKLLVIHRNSGDYQVRMDPPAPQTDLITAFASPSGTVEPDGVLVAWAAGNMEKCRIFIESTSAKPLTVTGIQRIGNIHDGGGLR